jgi:hypothetical protein
MRFFSALVCFAAKSPRVAGGRVLANKNRAYFLPAVKKHRGAELHLRKRGTECIVELAPIARSSRALSKQSETRSREGDLAREIREKSVPRLGEWRRSACSDRTRFPTQRQVGVA